ncbi:tetratricopeptide repeat protein [Fluviicola sp.]|uniref:tetratricopeptide repeat protein n=1 Tax=Fluviicola sp. TaxID=1917219 RepID=UPI0026178718|nr:tetratricopeptide repeat protein [Fluviicola sp.]
MVKQLLFCLFSIIGFVSFSQEKSKLLHEGEELFAKEDYKKALNVFNKEARTNHSVDVKFWIASCYFQLKKYDIAKKGFLEIVRRGINDENQELSLMNLGSCYLNLEQNDSALYYYEQIIENFPKASNAYYYKGLILYEETQFKEAKENYDQAIAIDSTDWRFYIRRQDVSYALSEFGDALTDLLKARELNPDLDISINIAYCYSMLEKYREADLIYKQIYDEKDFRLLNNYGLIRHKLGFSKEGEELIRKSLKLEPKNSYAYRNLAIIAIDNKDLTNACIYLKKAQELQFFTKYGAEVDNLILKHCN